MSERCEDCGEPLPHASLTCIDKLNERRLYWQGRYQDTVIEADRLREALRAAKVQLFGDEIAKAYKTISVALGDTPDE